MEGSKKDADKRENREKNSVLRTGRGIGREGKDGVCGSRVEFRGAKGH